jgi:hypothetical protein
MIDNSTLCIQSTDAWTWINAPVVSAALVTRAVWVLNTFWSTSSVRISYIINWTFACSTVSLGSAFCSNTTRGWSAGIFRSCGDYFGLDNYWFCTTNERIACHAARAGTDGIVIFDDAVSSNSACAWARVDTFLINAGFVLRTVTAGHAFGTARCAKVTWQARAHCLIVDWTTFCVVATRTWIARLSNDWLRNNWFNRYNNMKFC